MAGKKDIALTRAAHKSPQDLTRELRLVLAVVVTCVAACTTRTPSKSKKWRWSQCASPATR